MSISKRFTILLFVSALSLASCGGDEGDGSATTASTTSEGVAATTPSTTGNEPAMQTTTTTTTVGTATGGRNIEVVFDDGRSWTFVGECVYTPDNSGPASALWSIDGEAADGATFTAIMAFPFDAAETTPVLIGAMVDADEDLYILIESEDVSDESNLILNLGLHDGAFKSIDDPVDITAVATCQP